MSLVEEVNKVQVTAVSDILYGDGGKGKTVDHILSDPACTVEIAVKSSGGPGTGTTVHKNGKDIALTTLPASVFTEGKLTLLKGQVLIDPRLFVSDITKLRGVRSKLRSDELILDGRLPVTFPYHAALDIADNYRLGTTGRGVGPTASDFVGRTYSICLDDLFDKDLEFKIENAINGEFINERIQRGLNNDNLSTENEGKLRDLLKRYGNGDRFNPDKIANEYRELAAEHMDRFIGNASEILYFKYKNGEQIMLICTQGSRIDLVNGDFPFVSSNPATVNGVLYNSGLPKVDLSLCVIKGLPTKVGAGPLPTEIKGDEAERLRKKGSEYGANTGRPRRVFYHVIAALEYALWSTPNPLLVINKMDTLAGDSLSVFDAYNFNIKEPIVVSNRKYLISEILDFHPVDPRVLEHLVGHGEHKFDPFEDATKFTKLSELDGTEIGRYKNFFEEKLGVRVLAVGNGKTTYIE